MAQATVTSMFGTKIHFGDDRDGHVEMRVPGTHDLLVSASELRAAIDKVAGPAPEQKNPRTLAADDITDAMIDRARWFNEHLSPETVRKMLTAALTEPTRPEEKVERVLRRYWSGDINGTDLADRIVEEMNR